MPEAKTVSAPAINLVDESFDPKKSGSYHLSLLINKDTFSYSILDANTNKYLVLNSGKATFPNSEALEKLGGNFKSITCAVAHTKFSLVPTALFDEENKNPMLGFNHPLEKDEKSHADTFQNIDAKNIFSISADIQFTVRKYFPQARILHNATSFIEGILILNKNNKVKKVFADFHSDYFEIAILDGRELLFSNAFSYKTSEDIAYYILFVYEQLKLNPEEIELVLSGEIEKTAKEHSLLYNYIRHVKFASLSESFKYSYKFDEIPSHRFFSLFNQYLCV